MKVSSQSNEEYYFEEGCYIRELLNTADDPALSIAQARVESGQSTLWHRLEGIEERYLILSGRGEVEVGDREREPVGPGDLVRIPAGVRQRIHNAGECDLLFLALCTPRFVPSAYRALES
ncbi:MAG: hypothetical protein Kow006_06300 [Gammaproteobacteria bacterium]